MRMMMTATLPIEPFNSLVRDGTIGSKIGSILEELAPEAAYFVEQEGQRAAVLIVDVPDQTKIPFYAEPFFLVFKAECRFRIAMTPEDLGKAGLDKLGKRWS